MTEQDPVAWRWKVSPMQLNWQYSEQPPAKFPIYNLELLYTSIPSGTGAPALYSNRENSITAREMLKRILQFYDGIEREHAPGEAELLDEVSAAIASYSLSSKDGQ